MLTWGGWSIGRSDVRSSVTIVILGGGEGALTIGQGHQTLVTLHMADNFTSLKLHTLYSSHILLATHTRTLHCEFLDLLDHLQPSELKPNYCILTHTPLCDSQLT